MKKSIKKLIKKYKKIEPDLKFKYKPKYFASIEIYNKGGLISVLEPYQLKQRIKNI
jgi:hypothetical protein